MKKKLKELVNAYLGKEEKEYERIYVRQSKGKSIIGFIFSLLIMLILIFVAGFKFHFIFLTIFIIDLIIIVYYGINLFTKKGIKLPKYVQVEKRDDDKYQI